MESGCGPQRTRLNGMLTVITKLALARFSIRIRIRIRTPHFALALALRAEGGWAGADRKNKAHCEKYQMSHADINIS